MIDCVLTLSKIDGGGTLSMVIYCGPHTTYEKTGTKNIKDDTVDAHCIPTHSM